MATYPSNLATSSNVVTDPVVNVWGLPACTNSEIMITTEGDQIQSPDGSYVDDISPGESSYNETSNDVMMYWTSTGMKTLNVSENTFYGIILYYSYF
jgi:hypothetical protein